MLSRLLRPLLLAVGFGALAAAPASAASQLVTVSDYAFSLPGVVIEPGESVTWSYAGGGLDHHNVFFEDSMFTMPSVPLFAPWPTMPTRTFSTPGVYPYYCQDHGGPGGVGMSGIVYVGQAIPGAAPNPSFTATPGAAVVGQSVTFDASGTTDADNDIKRY
ncbi:MAG: cupredoxin domain-containing protein, partial [Solirubrobacteraceae bacterium]